MDVEVRGEVRLFGGRSSEERVALERRYADLWAEFGASVTRLAASYEAAPQAREDLLQDIRLAIWMALPRFRGESSVRTFVFRIAHNRASTHVWRRRKTISTEALESVDVPDAQGSPDKAMFESLDHARFLAAIRSLPAPMKQVIILALEEIPHREIAAILGTSEGNVAVRLTRARAALRQKLVGSE